MKVSLISKSDLNPLDLASHAARICYSKGVPQLGDRINVEEQLFKTGHHTTLSHFNFTFLIDEISISDVTFGLHLFSSFYNSDQQSGRYSKMYDEPGFEKVKNYILDLWPAEKPEDISSQQINRDLQKTEQKISTTWPNLKKEDLKAIEMFLKKGVEIYQQNIDQATELAKQKLKQERPHINDKMLERNAGKIAQEQLRVFISTAFPTRLDYTINLVGLLAFYNSAWNPSMKKVAQMMVNLIVKEYPEIKYMFKRRQGDTWLPKIEDKKGVEFSPRARLIRVDEQFEAVFPENSEKHPVDLLHAHPKFMSNSLNQIISEVELSIMTYGQDQRHRTISRSQPIISGNFFLPPLVKILGLEKAAEGMLDAWYDLIKKIPESLAIMLAPYGLMVKYTKSSDFNAVIHEMEKRLCWCAQQEIYEVALDLYKQIEAGYPQLTSIFEPPCYRDKCLEGARYCGRDLSSKNNPAKFFVSREV